MTADRLTIRSFTWQDVPLLLGLQAGHGLADPAPSEDDVAELRRWLHQPNLAPERDCLIAFEGETPAGYVYLSVEPAIGRGVLTGAVLPGHEGETEAALVDAAVAAGQGFGLSILDWDAAEQDTRRQGLLEAHGFSHVRTHLHQRRDETSHTGATTPAGATLRQATRDDVQVVTEVQNAAFTGSWGFCPNTPEEVGYRIFEQPQNPPDVVLLLEIDGRAVGYCWTHVDAPGEPGIVGMVGVLPDQQGSGFGRVVTAAGVDHLVSTGATPLDITVDSENTPAVRLYESLGFRTRWRSVWYRKELRG